MLTAPIALVVTYILSLESNLIGERKLVLNGTGAKEVTLATKKTTLLARCKLAFIVINDDIEIAVKQILFPVAGVHNTVLVCAVENELYLTIVDGISATGRLELTNIRLLATFNHLLKDFLLT